MPPKLYSFLSRIPLLVQIKKNIDRCEFIIWRWRQQYRRKRRQTLPQRLSYSHRFCTLCVKRTVYVDFAIDQINSLHYYNPYHVFDILGDDTCQKYFETQKHRLDYPANTAFVSLTKETPESWQHYKIEALQYAIEHDGILMDADMYWYADPVVGQWQALFFTHAYFIKDEFAEKQLVTKVFRHPEWAEFPHYTTGVLYLPYSLYTPSLKNKLETYIKVQTDQSYSFLKSPAQKDILRRLVDEMAINLAFQTSLPPTQITTLKATDSPGNRQTVLSMYYGSMNRILS